MKTITITLTEAEAKALLHGAGNTYAAMSREELVDLHGSAQEARAGMRAYERLAQACEGFPSDFEIKSLIHVMREDGLNLELGTIAACLASKKGIKCTDVFQRQLHTRLKALVKAGQLKRAKFLPGRPFYVPS